MSQVKPPSPVAEEQSQEVSHASVEHVELLTVEVNGIRMRYAHSGDGPLLIFCHGFPETWYSWRHQLRALAGAGFRCAAPDMRGTGGTEAPENVESYTLLHLVGDMIELVSALKEREAVIVGHDWGALVAWHAALLRPDVIRAVVGMSVPWTPPGRKNTLAILQDHKIDNHYLQYFQKPGAVESEMEADVRRSLRRVYFTLGGEGSGGRYGFWRHPPGGGILDGTVDPPKLPGWLSEADLDYAEQEFSRTGFRGQLNWYRNIPRNAELLAAWRYQPITQPALFMAGDLDGVLGFPGSRGRIEAFPKTLPHLRASHLMENVGHWVQQEQSDRVNGLLIDFLRAL